MRCVIAPMRRANPEACSGDSYTSIPHAQRSHHGAAPRSLTRVAPQAGQPVRVGVTAAFWGTTEVPADPGQNQITMGRP